LADDNSIGRLRWPVYIATRQQVPDPASPGFVESLANTTLVHANVQPMGPMTFYAGMQVDTPVTHKIFVRWLDWLDTTCIIYRQTLRPDRSTRIEIFRIRRVMELEGRKRFLRLDCEQEMRA
jgi:head-tail adaptor